MLLLLKKNRREAVISVVAEISFCCFSVLIYGRIWKTFVVFQDPLRFALASGTGTTLLVGLIVLRIYLVRSFYIIQIILGCYISKFLNRYLFSDDDFISSWKGWSYVGDRLLSAVVPYEETGWYDGQMWVKPPEVCLPSHYLHPAWLLHTHPLHNRID